MMPTLRLAKDLEALIDNAAYATGKSRSEIVRAALEQYCRQIFSKSKMSVYDKLVASGYKPIAIGPGDLSTNKERLKTKIRERS